jgi:16S rRNA (uracil1498-N3)-methyltransferase
MRIPRIYVAEPLQLGQSLLLPEQAARHVNQVLRLSVGSPLILFNGEGGEYAAKIVELKKRAVTVSLEEFVDRNVESPMAIHLGQAISRGERMDIALQKSVELGVKEITPLFTERCGVKLQDDRLQKRMRHWLGVIESACEQCGRNSLPVLHEPLKLPAWLQASEGKGFVLDPLASKSFMSAELDEQKSLRVLIGPEGGLSDMEVKEAILKGFEGLTLGPRILRTETAAIAVLSIVQARWGDF